MLNLVTLWIVFTANFLALGVVWFYVARSYPNFQAARFWGAAALLVAIGAATSILREFVSPLVPLLVAGTLLIMACSLIHGGIEKFYGEPVSWGRHLALVGLSSAGMAFFIWYPSSLMRVVIFSAGLAIAIGMTVSPVLKRSATARNPGARLAGGIGAILIVMIVLRTVSLAGGGGDVNLVHFNAFQAVLVLVLVFLSIVWNFGFLLMAIDRLRAEVEQLALVDDLTGVANRRQLLARLTEECARSNRTLEPFVLLVIDLDRFKTINDGHGHAAGDACLKLFASTVEKRLRTGDLLARMGGDEFCAVLPSTTLREGEAVAQQLLEASRTCVMHWNGKLIPLTSSIGIAQWSSEARSLPQSLIVAADQALYASKSEGRDRHASFKHDMATVPLLKTA